MHYSLSRCDGKRRRAREADARTRGCAPAPIIFALESECDNAHCNAGMGLVVRCGPLRGDLTGAKN